MTDNPSAKKVILATGSSNGIGGLSAGTLKGVTGEIING